VPIAWSLDRTHGIANLTITSPHTFAEWRRAMDEILATEPVPSRFLVDRRNAGAPATAFIDDMVAYFRAHADQLAGCTAAVVVGSEAAFGMGRMLEIRTEVSGVNLAMKIFLDYDHAVRWLHGADAR
jgi:hypothetical protein